VAEAGTCSVESGTTRLFTFSSTTARDKWLTLGARLGPVVVGPNWAIITPNEDAAGEIAGATGGEAR
jgi:hypothetical protein